VKTEEKKICEWCNIEFEGRIGQKYCSEKCRWSGQQKRWRHEKHYTITCMGCREEKPVSKKKAVYCSLECRNADYSIRNTKFLDIPACIEGANRKLDKNLGYDRVYVPMHPEANTWGYVYEHRVIAEKMIGRSLLKGEIVHHKNGKRWDNREENLEVMTQADHGKLHGQRPEDLDI